MGAAAAYVVPAVASVAGGMLGAKGAEKAGQQQADAAKDAAFMQLQMYNQTREDLTPWRDVGASALGRLAQMYGLSAPAGQTATQAAAPPQSVPQQINAPQAKAPIAISPLETIGGDWEQRKSVLEMTGTPYQITGLSQEQLNAQYAPQPMAPQAAPAQGATIDGATGQVIPQQADYSSFYESPDYQFALQEGEKALQRQGAAGGSLYSGGQLRAATRYGQGLATQQYSNYANRLAALAGIGQTTGTQLGQLGQSAAGQAGSAGMAAGQARASGYLGQTQAYGNTLNQLSSLYGDYQQANPSWTTQNPNTWNTTPGSQQSQMLASQW